MPALIDDAVKAAGDAASLAGRLIRARLADDLRVHLKGKNGDLVTDLDLDVEKAIIKRIRKSFPDHRIITEEQGEIDGDPEWTWLVDPLDGTNNIALRLPLFGSCVTLCHGKRPIVTAIHAGHRGVTYTAVRGRGAACTPSGVVRVRDGFTPGRTTISWMQGYSVSRDAGGDAAAARNALGGRFKRTLQNWAPSVDWALLVEGAIGAVVAYDNEPEDLVGGALLAAEAGAVVTDLHGNAVTDPGGVSSLVAAAPDVLGPVLDALAAGMGRPGQDGR